VPRGRREVKPAGKSMKRRKGGRPSTSRCAMPFSKSTKARLLEQNHAHPGPGKHGRSVKEHKQDTKV